MRHSLLAIAASLCAASVFAQSSNPMMARLRPTLPEVQVAMEQRIKVLAEKTKAAASKDKPWLETMAKTQALVAKSVKVVKVPDCKLPESESTYRLHCTVSYTYKDENGKLASEDEELIFFRKDDAWTVE